MDASVIIPFTRPAGAKKAITSLLDQKTRFSYEIILVGQKKNFSQTPVQVKRIESDKKLLPGKARNLGTKSAKGNYFLFLDDDCLAESSWIEKNIDFLKGRKNVGAVGGKITGYSKKFFGLCTDYTNFWRQQGNILRRVNQLYAASLGVKKEAFLDVGGFDEKVSVGEDINFVNRLDKAGYLSYYDPDIVVFHDHKRDNLGKFLKYMSENGLSTGPDVLKAHRGNHLVGFLWPILERAYFLLVVPLAVLYTGASFSLNFSSSRKIVFFLPFMFLGYLTYHFGVAVKLLMKVLV
jgi:GT2 family glycosyltransferase